MKVISSILLLSFLLAAENDMKLQYIIADVANVRNKPGNDAYIVAKARIGSYFRPRKESSDWFYLDTLYIKGSGDILVNGWIHSSACIENRVDTIFIDEQFKKAKTFADTLKWCERRVALTPENKMYLRALQKGYLATGDTARSTAIGMRIRGTDPTYIAQKQGNKVYLLGVIDSTGDFRTLQWLEYPEFSYVDEYQSSKKVTWRSPQGYDDIKKDALLVRATIGSAMWYSYDGVTRCFPAPAVEPSDSLRALATEYGIPGAHSDIEGNTAFKIYLGTAQDWEASYFATKPLHRVKVCGITEKSEYDSLNWYKTQLVDTAFNQTGVSRIYFAKLTEYGYVDVIIGSMMQCQEFHQRGIFNQKRKSVWPVHGEVLEYSSMDKHLLQLCREWFRFGPDASSQAYCVTPFSTHIQLPDFTEHNGIHGLQFVSISRKDFKIFTILSEYGGD